MVTADFEKRLFNLSNLVGNPDQAERFNDDYQTLLVEIKVLPGARFAFAERLRRLGDIQLEFLMNQWIKEDREQWAPGWVR